LSSPSALDGRESAKSTGLAAEQRWGPGGKAFASEVPTRTVVVYPLNDRQSVVVSWQQGYAGPPGGPGVERLREILGRT